MSESSENKKKIIFVSILTVISIFLTFYTLQSGDLNLIYSHFFYIPIILACIWWGYFGILLSFILSCILLILSFFDPIDSINVLVFEDILVVFVMNSIALMVAIVSERRHRVDIQLKSNLKQTECLYDLTRLTNHPLISVDEILIETAHMIKKYFRIPEEVSVKINFRDKDYFSKDYCETKLKTLGKESVRDENLLIEVFHKNRIENPKDYKIFIRKIAEHLTSIFEFKLK